MEVENCSNYFSFALTLQRYSLLPTETSRQQKITFLTNNQNYLQQIPARDHQTTSKIIALCLALSKEEKLQHYRLLRKIHYLHLSRSVTRSESLGCFPSLITRLVLSYLQPKAHWLLKAKLVSKTWLKIVNDPYEKARAINQHPHLPIHTFFEKKASRYAPTFIQANFQNFIQKHGHFIKTLNCEFYNTLHEDLVTIFHHCPAIQRIKITKVFFDLNVLHLLFAQPHLRSLALILGTPIANDTPSHPEQLSHLDALILDGWENNNDFFYEYLSNFNLSNLKILSLEHNKSISNAAFQYFNFKDLSHLHTLNLKQCTQINDMGLTPLFQAYLPFLDTLNLYESPLSGSSFQFLKKNAPNVRVLNLARCFNFDDVGVEHLLTFSRLENLNLDSCQKITNKGLKQLSSLHLKTLILKSTLMTDDLLTCFGNGNLKDLEILNLSLCIDLTSLALKNIAQAEFKKMHTIDFSFCRKIKDDGVFALARSPHSQLKHLFFESCRLLTSLSVYYLSHGNLMGLKTLNFKTCEKLKVFPFKECLGGNLFNLRVVNQGVFSIDSDETTQLLTQPLFKQLELTQLIFQNTTNQSLSYLTECNLSTLEELDLSFSIISDESLISLAKGNISNLRRIVLRECPNITHAGIMKMLEQGKKIIFIDTRNCPHITPKNRNKYDLITKQNLDNIE